MVTRFGAACSYSQITPSKGTGFILTRLAYLKEATRKEVYENSHYGHYTDGYHCLLWKALLEEGMIECTNGRLCNQKYLCFSGYTNSSAIKSYKKETPRYRLTESGWQTFRKMVDKYRPTMV